MYCHAMRSRCTIREGGGKASLADAHLADLKSLWNMAESLMDVAFLSLECAGSASGSYPGRPSAWAMASVLTSEPTASMDSALSGD